MAMALVLTTVMADLDDKIGLNMKERIGFIGLGDIGKPMAACLLGGGYGVTSCANRSRGEIEELKTQGLSEVDDAFVVGEAVRILFSVVVDEAQTDAVLRGPRGALASLRAGSTVIVMSTVSPVYCQDLAAEAARKGIAVIDCPVSGGSARAERGKLALICGASADSLERCRAVLETMGTIYHCGEVGMGQVAKLANQGMVFSIVQLVQEARTMANSYGMDLDALMQVLNRSSARSVVGDHWPFFYNAWPHLAALGKKDVELCLEAARAKGVSMPLVDARKQLSWGLDALD
jgi:3-hydroxyisobutyrate dehydrogenase-like beta-hydroxyacid dehydrogenase